MVVRGRRVGGGLGEQGHAGCAEQATDDHEWLPDLQPVRQQPGHDEGECLDAPVPVAQPVRLRFGVAEVGREEDDEEADGDVVEEQEHGDGERRADDVEAQHLAPVPLERHFGVDAAGAGLDERAVAQADHQLVAQAGSQFAQSEEGDGEDDHTDDAADAELELPVGVGVEGVARHLGHDEAADDRAQCPEAHRGGPAQLRGEVADERRRRHQDDAFDEADCRDEDQVVRLAVDERDGVGEDAGDEQSVDHQVGPAPAVGEAGEDRCERADGIAHNGHENQERQGHVQVEADLRGDRAADIQLVVENDCRDDHDAEVEGAGPVRGVAAELPAPDSIFRRYGRRGWFSRSGCHHVPFCGGTGGTAPAYRIHVARTDEGVRANGATTAGLGGAVGAWHRMALGPCGVQHFAKLFQTARRRPR